MNLSRVPHLRPAPPAEPPPRSDGEVVSAAEWLARAPVRPGAILLGLPFAEGSISRARCDLAPAEVRRTLARFTVWSSDLEMAVDGFPVLDAGDVEPVGEVERMQARIEEVAGVLGSEAPVPLAALGGDDSITVGLALGTRADALLTFDTHHDCRDPSSGATNGSPVRQLVERGVTRVVQIGIHGFANAEAHARWARERGIQWFSGSHVREEGVARVARSALDLLGPAARIWVDVDLDVLDRAFAPGAPAALPGGLGPHDLERAAWILGGDARVVGLGIVELDPTTDVTGGTVRTACAVLLSFLAGVAGRHPAPAP